MRPLAGRKLWFVGLGGSGMSALAIVAKAWGAAVGGSDRSRTPYFPLLARHDIDVVLGHAAENVPEGWEVVFSTAIPPDNPELRTPGPLLRRGELLAELCALRPSIVVAGAHGKTTTAGMIAFALDRLGLDPAFLIGGEIPQLGGNARAGDGWLVAEGDESDRSLALLSPRIAVVTNVELDHHATFASQAEVEELFESWLASLPPGAMVIRGEEVELPDRLELALPGEHNRRNAACALAALEAAGADTTAAQEALLEFRGARRRLEARGESAGVHVYDDYAHHPSEIAATLDAARSIATGGRLIVLFQPHLYTRTLHLALELAGALRAADLVCVTEVYGARESPLDGVSGKLVVERLCELEPGMAVGWMPLLEDSVELVASEARAGDLVLTMGAGDVDLAVPLILERLEGTRDPGTEAPGRRPEGGGARSSR